MFFDQEIMLFNEDAKSSTEVITKLASQLEKRGLVKKDFLNHTLIREDRFPTGLATEGLGIAIPHTDSKYVNQSQIAFASLNKPVLFKNMVNINEEIPVSLVFMIAMASPHEQVNLLQNLMDLFQSEQILEKLYACTTKNDVLEISREHNVP